MRTLELPAGKSPREWGRIHGESFRGEVKALTAIRVYLCTSAGRGHFTSKAAVIAAAERHLPVLQRYDEPLYDELVGIAEGADLSPAEIVVCNHYTDLRDLGADPASWTLADDPRAEARGGDADGGCSVIFARAVHGPILAQTWDMHATAIPYTMVLKLPDAVLLTLTGCVGLAGMNAHHVAIAINNLNSRDARIGVVWPALVRRALRDRTARAARDTILAAPVGSGHHYVVADRRDAYAIETSGVLRKLIFASEDGGAPTAYAHTNHCLDAEVAAVTDIPAGSTSRERYAWLEASLGARAIYDLDDAWKRMGSQEGWPKSICTNMATPESPHGSATCGAIAMSPQSGRILAQGGLVTNVAPEVFYI